MTDTLTPRQDQELNRFNTTDFYFGTVFNTINCLSYAYVATKLIKNPQQHLAILCSCFGLAALVQSAWYIIYLTNGNHTTEALNILNIANDIFFCVGHWKFVFQFFVSAIDTKNIMWNGTDWHIRQIILFKVPLDWVVTTLIILSFLACFFGG